MEHPRQTSPSAETSDALPASDELADKVAEDLALTPAASQEVVAEAAERPRRGDGGMRLAGGDVDGLVCAVPRLVNAVCRRSAIRTELRS